MHYIRLTVFSIFSLAVVSLISCNSQESKTAFINISLYDSIPREMYYTVPVNGVATFAYREKIDFDSSGTASLSIETENPVFIQLITLEEVGTFLLVEPGMTYDVRFNSKSGTENVEIISQNSEGQKAINDLDNFPVLQVRADNYRDTNSAETVAALKNELDREIALFEKLRKENKISEEFLNLIITDRQVYYAALQATIAYLKFRDDERNNNGNYTPEAREMWESSFSNSVLDKSNMSTNWYYELLDVYIKYELFHSEDYSPDSIKALLEAGKYRTHITDLASDYLVQDEAREFFDATYLHYWAFQRTYDNEFLSMFNDFKDRYPESRYSSFLAPEIELIRQFNMVEETPRSDQFFITEDREKIKTLSELFKRFRGERLYVSVWATWCGPCKDDFDNNPQLYELLDEKGIKTLYIAADKDDRDKMYRNMANFYALKGSNIRTTDSLMKDLFRQFSPKGNGVELPWYILVDETGEIVVRHASSPKKLEKLKKEIEGAFETSIPLD